MVITVHITLPRKKYDQIFIFNIEYRFFLRWEVKDVSHREISHFTGNSKSPIYIPGYPCLSLSIRLDVRLVKQDDVAFQAHQPLFPSLSPISSSSPHFSSFFIVSITISSFSSHEHIKLATISIFASSFRSWLPTSQSWSRIRGCNREQQHQVLCVSFRCWVWKTIRVPSLLTFRASEREADNGEDGGGHGERRRRWEAEGCGGHSGSTSRAAQDWVQVQGGDSQIHRVDSRVTGGTIDDRDNQLMEICHDPSLLFCKIGRS